MNPFPSDDHYHGPLSLKIRWMSDSGIVSSDCIDLIVDCTDTIEALKHRLADSGLIGIPIERQMVIFAGATLNDTRTFDDYAIRDTSTLYIVPHDVLTSRKQR